MIRKTRKFADVITCGGWALTVFETELVGIDGVKDEL